jgi:hypothetical protein
MKNNISLNLKNILFIIFAVGSIITFLIIYRDINNSFTYKFVIGYVIFLFLFCLYLIFMIILNTKKLKWIEIRKRLVKFIVLFGLFGALNYIMDYVFRPSKIDLLREFSGPLGLSLAISFHDLIFFKKIKN